MTLQSALLGPGLHKDLRTEVPKLKYSDCTVQVAYSIPSSFILDKFQVEELIQEGRFTNASLVPTVLSLPETDLELPYGQAKRETVMLWLGFGRPDFPFALTLPLHLRTHLPTEGKPSKEKDMRVLEIPEPLIGLSCPAITNRS